MKEHQAVYKCRFCGKYFVNEFQNVSEEHWEKYGGSPSATSFHNCADGYRAAGDFVTYILADEDEIHDRLEVLNKNENNSTFTVEGNDILIQAQSNGKMT